VGVLNTGRLNLYLWGFELAGDTKVFRRGRLLAAGAGDIVYYYIPPPADLHPGEQFELTLYLKDKDVFSKTWVSEHGGRMDSTPVEKDGKPTDTYAIRVWSYETFRERWDVHRPPEGETSATDPEIVEGATFIRRKRGTWSCGGHVLAWLGRAVRSIRRGCTKLLRWCCGASATLWSSVQNRIRRILWRGKYKTD
jgi:hypothetical protein